MFFSKIELNRNGVSINDAIGLANWDGYEVHHQIWRFFSDGPKRRRDFIYRQDQIDGWPRYYTVSVRPPVDTGGLWELACKPYEPRITANQRLRFSMRVNPVRTKRDESGRQHRHDVVMDEKMKLRRQKIEACDHSEVVRRAGLAWLEKRACANGFVFDENHVIVSGYLQHCLFHKKGRPSIRFSTIEFDGLLKVIDPELFLKGLYAGIGPAKGFGCGLMMVRGI